jgi:tetratricopeptide (TPR) repeat protein
VTTELTGWPFSPPSLPSFASSLRTPVRQHSQAIKTADQILKKYPNNGRASNSPPLLVLVGLPASVLTFAFEPVDFPTPSRTARPKETISMKALVLFHSPANPELKLTQADNERDGLVLGKQGVAKDPDSQLCWHILGMLQRAKKEYALASKSFGQALKADPVR